MVWEFWKLNKIELKCNVFDLNGIWDYFVVWDFWNRNGNWIKVCNEWLYV